MRNQTLYALTSRVAISEDYTINVASVFVENKKEAKQIRKTAIKHGVFQLMGDIVEIDPTDWTITIYNPEIPNTYPLPNSKGFRFYHEALHYAELFKQVLPRHFIVEVVKFDETQAYQFFLTGNKSTEALTSVQGGDLCVT